LNRRCAVAFIHPGTLPGAAPFAVDFLLDTTRAAYLLVRNGIRRKYRNIHFILSHGGGCRRLGWMPLEAWRAGL
jgi:6-methylsalicylate decarboxylase